ncbi:hypothetical protein AB0F43_29810 [Kribbella sp. NPDC023972]|uniref:hypothetical protein n=1 Tax=Kribbella sp. NPDC023972 TaxID=3154795 RepID=UPI0033C6BDB3
MYVEIVLGAGQVAAIGEVRLQGLDQPGAAAFVVLQDRTEYGVEEPLDAPRFTDQEPP